MTGKTIKQFSLATSLLNSDAFMFQRGGSYYYTTAQKLTSGAYVDDTYANTAVAKSGSTLVRGATYYITDKYVFLFALDADKFDLNGVYFARNADYQSAGNYAGITTTAGFTVNATGTNLGLWTTALTPASGDVAIWNNLHWLNITGANGASNPSADAVNWEAVANTDVDVADTYGYIYEYDGIEYNFDNNSINRRVDGRGNDISGGTVTQFKWGDDNVQLNIVSANGYLPIKNTFGSISNNKIDAYIVGLDFQSNTIFENNTINGYKFDFIDYYSTGNTINYLTLVGTSTNSDTITIATYGNFQQLSTYIGVGGEITINVKLTTTAYAGGTTYTFGDFATSGTKTYMYINKTDSAGNIPPNATYWVEVFDFTTAGRYKLTISKWFAVATTINLISTNATETIDEIVYDVYHYNTKFTCETGLAVTFDNTAYASLANAGEILASANIVVDGDKSEFSVLERIDIGGTKYVREVYSQTAIA